jgi:hypothetical protein
MAFNWLPKPVYMRTTARASGTCPRAR